MKTIYILALLCALCVTAFAQTSITLPRKTQVFYWDTEGSPAAWSSLYSYTHTYNSRGQEVEQVQARTYNMIRVLNTYENFILKESLSQSWDMNTSTWITDSKSSHTYDAQGRQSTITTQGRTATNQLINTEQTIYLYTGLEPIPTTIVYQAWDATTNTWKDKERDTNFMWTSDLDHVTHPTGLIMYETQTFDATTNTWVNKERYNSTYNSTTRTLTSTIETASGAGWVNSTREIITYDDKKNMTGFRSEEWKDNAWELDSEIQYLLTYNASNVFLIEKITQSRDTEGEAFENQFKEVYSDFQTFNVMKSAEQLPESVLAVFPNPTSSNLKVALNSVEFKDAQVELYTLQGHKVYGAAISQQSLASGSHVISTEHLSKGMYILHIRTDNNKEISRRVVRR